MAVCRRLILLCHTEPSPNLSKLKSIVTKIISLLHYFGAKKIAKKGKEVWEGVVLNVAARPVLILIGEAKKQGCSSRYSEMGITIPGEVARPLPDR